MSRYTTQVRYICETYANLGESAGLTAVKDVIAAAIPKVFDFDFPIYEEAHRAILCEKILRHYYTWEIGFESVALWKLHLENFLVENMPYYNQLYAIAAKEIDPLGNMDLHRTYVKSNTADSVSNGATNSTSKDRYSDTPQGGLDGLETDTYLTNARITDNDNESKSTVTANGNETHDEHISGMTGDKTFSQRLAEYRKANLNVDLEIINSLEPLFMGLWQ